MGSSDGGDHWPLFSRSRCTTTGANPAAQRRTWDPHTGTDAAWASQPASGQMVAQCGMWTSMSLIPHALSLSLFSLSCLFLTDRSHNGAAAAATRA